jgi:hypothetical protein
MLAALSYVLFFFILDTVSRVSKRHTLQNRIDEFMDKVQRASLFAFMAVAFLDLVIIACWAEKIGHFHFEWLLDLTFIFLVPTLRIYHLAKRDVAEGLPWVDE